MLLSFSLGGNPPIGQYALGGLSNDGEYTDQLTAFVDNRRIVQIRPKLFGHAIAVQPKFAVFVGKRLSPMQDNLENMVVEIGDLRPRFQNVATSQAGMAGTPEPGIGVIVDHDALGSPEHHDGNRGLQ